MHARTRREEEEEDDDQNDPDEKMNDDGDDDQIQDDETLADSNLLASFEFAFAKELRQPTRQLLVKDVMFCFDPASIYGKRTGFHKALMVTDPWCNWGKMALLAS